MVVKVVEPALMLLVFMYGAANLFESTDRCAYLVLSAVLSCIAAFSASAYLWGACLHSVTVAAAL